MFPAQFDYVVPKSLTEAIALLTQHGDRAKLLAGGHSLIPAMKLRLAQPELLVDLAKLRELSYIAEKEGKICIGAMTTHYEVESSPRLREICPLLPETAGHIGDVQVRNKGTVGGSLAHADPAADWPAAMIALQAEFVVAGPNGERLVKADGFFVDLLTTALAPNEILREIRVPRPAPHTGHAYGKMPQPASGFAVVGVAAAITRDGRGNCTSAGVGVTGLAAKAYRAMKTEHALRGSACDITSIERAAAQIADGVEPNTDLFASADYRRHVATVYAKRTIERAAELARR